MKKSEKSVYLILLFAFIILILVGVLTLSKPKKEDETTTTITEVSTTEKIQTSKDIYSTTQIMVDVLRNKFFEFEVPFGWEYEQMESSTIFMVAPENVNNFLGNIKIQILEKTEIEEFSWEEFCVSANVDYSKFQLSKKDEVKVDSIDCTRLEYFLHSNEYYEARTTVILELEDVTIYVTLAQDSGLTYKKTFSNMLESLRIL